MKRERFYVVCMGCDYKGLMYGSTYDRLDGSCTKCGGFLLVMIDPIETPTWSMLPKTTCKATIHDWLVDALG